MRVGEIRLILLRHCILQACFTTSILFQLCFFALFILLSFCLFRATPMEYGGSQARGLVRATVASLCHSYSYARYKPCLRPTHHSSWQRWILNPLSKARDRTHNLMVPSHISLRYAMTGTPERLTC